jgi:hypothetical protein
LQSITKGEIIFNKRKDTTIQFLFLYLYLDSTTFNAHLQIVWTQYNNCEISSKELLLALSSLNRKHEKKNWEKIEAGEESD